MTTFNDIETDAPEKNAREQLGNIFSVITSNYDRILTPLVGVIVGAIALLVVVGLYAHNWNSLNKVNGQLDEARAALAVPGPDLPPLDEQLLAWESALSNAIDARIDPSDDSEFVRTILGVALDTGVTLVTASAQRETTQEIDGLEFDAAPYLIRVSGEMTDIQSFLQKLESGIVETLEVTSSVATRDVDDFLVSVGVVVRSEIVTGEDPLDEQSPGTSDGSISVDSSVGSAR
jgi:hypothetical protein